MITWIKLKEGKWLFMKDGAQKELENFRQLYLWSSFAGIKDDDIVAAQMELDVNNQHNYAEFGMFKRFTFTGKL